MLQWAQCSIGNNRVRWINGCIVLAAWLVVAAEVVAGAAATKESKQGASSEQHRAQGYADPFNAQLERLAKQNALVRVSFNDKQTMASCPRSFLGLSFDLADATHISAPDYMTLVKRLSSYDTGPVVVRIGATTADRLTQVWSDQILNSLKQVHLKTGAKFILGVNLHSEDPKLTKAQVKRILEVLPRESIMSIAVGNEPDMYSLKPKAGKPGSISPKPSTWLNDRWIPASQQIYKAAADGQKTLSGPDWSDLRFKPGVLKWWLNHVGPTLNLVTVHFYGGDVFSDPSIEDLLSEQTITKRMPGLVDVVKTAKDFNLPVRVTEAATLSYGGVQGVSDIAGSAVWAVDTSMEVCNAGAVGINFHQSLKQENNANYNAIDYIGGRVRVRMPYYGYLMVQQAMDGGADIVSKAVTGECKAWVLRGQKNGDLRVLVVNKVNNKDCGVDVRLNQDQMARYKDTAEVDYLFSGDGLYEKWRLYLSGMTFKAWGTDNVEGYGDHMTIQKYTRTESGGTQGGFALSMLPGTKAMLITVGQKPPGPSSPPPPPSNTKSTPSSPSNAQKAPPSSKRPAAFVNSPKAANSGQKPAPGSSGDKGGDKGTQKLAPSSPRPSNAANSANVKQKGAPSSQPPPNGANSKQTPPPSSPQAAPNSANVKQKGAPSSQPPLNSANSKQTPPRSSPQAPPNSSNVKQKGAPSQPPANSANSKQSAPAPAFVNSLKPSNSANSVQKSAPGPAASSGQRATNGGSSGGGASSPSPATSSPRPANSANIGHKASSPGPSKPNSKNADPKGKPPPPAPSNAKPPNAANSANVRPKAAPSNTKPADFVNSVQRPQSSANNAQKAAPSGGKPANGVNSNQRVSSPASSSPAPSAASPRPPSSANIKQKVAPSSPPPSNSINGKQKGAPSSPPPPNSANSKQKAAPSSPQQAHGANIKPKAPPSSPPPPNSANSKQPAPKNGHQRGDFVNGIQKSAPSGGKPSNGGNGAKTVQPARNSPKPAANVQGPPNSVNAWHKPGAGGWQSAPNSLNTRQGQKAPPSNQRPANSANSKQQGAPGAQQPANSVNSKQWQKTPPSNQKPANSGNSKQWQKASPTNHPPANSANSKQVQKATPTNQAAANNPKAKQVQKAPPMPAEGADSWRKPSPSYQRPAHSANSAPGPAPNQKPPNSANSKQGMKAPPSVQQSAGGGGVKSRQQQAAAANQRPANSVNKPAVRAPQPQPNGKPANRAGSGGGQAPSGQRAAPRSWGPTIMDAKAGRPAMNAVKKSPSNAQQGAGAAKAPPASWHKPAANVQKPAASSGQKPANSGQKPVPNGWKVAQSVQRPGDGGKGGKQAPAGSGAKGQSSA